MKATTFAETLTGNFVCVITTSLSIWKVIVFLIQGKKDKENVINTELCICMSQNTTQVFFSYEACVPKVVQFWKQKLIKTFSFKTKFIFT